MSDSPYLVWQLVDSAFPTGAFAHSLGLEAAWQQGEVPDLQALERFVMLSVQQVGYGSLPAMNAGWRDPGRLEALDLLVDAFLINDVANRASRVQGRTLLATAARVWPSPALAALVRRAEATCAHVAPLSGVVFRTIGVPLPAAQRLTLFSAARSILSAAVRLGIVGSYEAQRLQHACSATLDRTLARCGDLDDDGLTQTAPLLDLLQAGHDRLYSRLFQS